MDKPKRLSFSRVNNIIYGGCEHRAINEVFNGNEACAIGTIVEDLLCGNEPDAELIEKYFTNKRTGAKKKNWETVEQLVVRLASTKEVAELLATAEKQVDVNFTLNGIPIKGYADFVTEDTVWDLKTTRSVTDLSWSDSHFSKVPWYVARHYAMQGAIYCKGLKKPNFKLIAIGKDTGEVRIIDFPEKVLSEAWEDFKSNAQYCWDLINKEIEPHRCEKCSFCAETRTTTYVEKSEMY